jgi:hypothetical protein
MPEMTTYERAVQIYQVLICAAHHRATMTYPMLGGMIGLPTQALGPHLEHIQSYCLENDLPPLTVLVVKTSGGKPGSGFHTAEDVDRARESVFVHNWFGMHPITPDTLRKMHE